MVIGVIMPKAFSDQEKDLIRELLIENGLKQFGIYGIKKTNVEDLAHSAGISKGAFYLFFNSKEELFLEIIEQFEEKYRSEVFVNGFTTEIPNRESFKQALKKAFSLWKSNPILKNFSQAEYEYLLRKLPQERVRAHLASDDIFIAELMEIWKSQGIEMNIEPDMVSGLIKALFYVSLHEAEFKKHIYTETLDLLIELVASHLFPE
jgi:AcrR family transcriptional regulator